MGLDTLVKILNFLKYFAPSMAFFNLIFWTMQITHPDLFKIINYVFGILPTICDNIYRIEIEIDDKTFTMGYVYAALLNLLLLLICTKVLNKIDRMKELEEEQEEQRRIIVENEIKKIKEQEKLKQIQHKEMFFALFEFNLEYFDNFGKDMQELEKLKTEYSKILSNKLKTKYQKVNFASKDKIFFFSNDYTLMNSITKDILKVFDVFRETGKKNRIITNMYFSYWADNKTANKMSVFKTLSQINELKNPNKIIVTNEIYIKLKSMENQLGFEFAPVGKFTLFKAYDDKDIEVEILEVKSLK